jgi:hypothetical protein
MSEFSSPPPIHESISQKQQLEFAAAIEIIVPFMHRNHQLSNPIDEVLEVTRKDGNKEWLVSKKDGIELVPESSMQERSIEEIIGEIFVIEDGEETIETEEKGDELLVPINSSDYSLEAVIYGKEGRYPTMTIKRWRVVKLNVNLYPSFEVEHFFRKEQHTGWEKVTDRDFLKKLDMFFGREMSFSELLETVNKKTEAVREAEQIMGESSTVFNTSRLIEAKGIIEELAKKLSGNT